MKITVIGCGNAFSHKNGNQSFLVEENGRKLLIDAGSRVPLFLSQQGYKISEIDDIYISHQHADHIGALEEFAFIRYDWIDHPIHWKEWKHGKPIRLIANETLMDELWEESLKGGLKSMEGFDATLETFFETHRVKADGKLSWEGWDVNLIQQIHVMTGNHIMPTYGLLFKKAGHKSVYFTTDSQHCSPRQIEIFYKQADVIFQDCECMGVDMAYEEGAKVYKDSEGKVLPWPEDAGQAQALSEQGFEPYKFERFNFTSGVHANYAQLAGYESASSIRLSKDIKAKMYLSHYQDFVSENGKDYKGNPVNWKATAEKDGFAGFIHVGQVFEF